MSARPAHEEFMDADMRRLWRQMRRLPGDLRLYGGTALALYRNHRHSTDFDFATPQAVVDPRFVGQLPWMAGADLRGGPGMVDGTLPGRSRTVKVTFMECGHLIPQPTRKPVEAPNGVAVAHPVDLVAAKLEACCNRGAQRDYEDVAEALAAWPGWCREAAGKALPNRGRAEIGRALAAPPLEVSAALPTEALRSLQAFARGLGRPERGLER